MKDIPSQVMAKCMEKNLDVMKPPYSEHINASHLVFCYIEVPLSVALGYEKQGLKQPNFTGFQTDLIQQVLFGEQKDQKPREQCVEKTDV